MGIGTGAALAGLRLNARLIHGVRYPKMETEILGFKLSLPLIVAPIGVAMFFAGVLVTEGTSVEKDLRMAQGETVTVGGYGFRFETVARVEGPNYIADEGLIRVFRGDREIAVLRPQ